MENIIVDAQDRSEPEISGTQRNLGEAAEHQAAEETSRGQPQNMRAGSRPGPACSKRLDRSSRRSSSGGSNSSWDGIGCDRKTRSMKRSEVVRPRDRSRSPKRKRDGSCEETPDAGPRVYASDADTEVNASDADAGVNASDADVEDEERMHSAPTALQPSAASTGESPAKRKEGGRSGSPPSRSQSRPPTTGDYVGRAEAKRKLLEVERQQLDMRMEVEVTNRLVNAVRSFPMRGEGTVAGIPLEDLAASADEAASAVEEVAVKSKNLKGTSVKHLKTAAQVMRVAVDELVSRVYATIDAKEGDPSAILQELTRVRKKLEAVEGENRRLRDEIETLKRAPPLQTTSQPPAMDSPREKRALRARKAVTIRQREPEEYPALSTPSDWGFPGEKAQEPLEPTQEERTTTQRPKPVVTEDKPLLQKLVEMIDSRLQQFMEELAGRNPEKPPNTRPAAETKGTGARKGGKKETPNRKTQGRLESIGGRRRGDNKAAPTPPAAPSKPPPQVDQEKNEEAWSTVVKRGGAKKAAKTAPPSATAKNPPPPKNDKGGKGKQTPVKTGQGKAGGPSPPSKRRVPRTAAVVLSCPEGESAKVLAEARRRVDFSRVGIADGMRARRTQTGATSWEIPGEGRAEKADALAEELKRIFADRNDVRIVRPVKTAEIRVSGMDDSIKEMEVAEAAAERGGCRPGDVKVGSITRAPNGLNTVWVRCPVAAAKQLAVAGHFTIGWTRVGVTLLSARPLQCYRCLETGHVRANCDSEADRSGLCYRCGGRNHKAQTCRERARCPVCLDAGRPAGHRVGSKACSPPTKKKGKRKGKKPLTVGPKPSPTEREKDPPLQPAEETPPVEMEVIAGTSTSRGSKRPGGGENDSPASSPNRQRRKTEDPAASK